mgnify:CR=1 FL=1
MTNPDCPMTEEKVAAHIDPSRLAVSKFQGLKLFLYSHVFDNTSTVFITPCYSEAGVDGVMKEKYVVPLTISEIMQVHPCAEEDYCIVKSVNLGDDEQYMFAISELMSCLDMLVINKTML